MYRTPYHYPSEPCQRSTLKMVADPKRIILERIDVKGAARDMARHMDLPRTVQQYEKKHSTAASAKTGLEPKELRRMYRGFSVMGSWGEEDRQDDNWHRKENDDDLRSERAESWQDLYPDFDDDG